MTHTPNDPERPRDGAGETWESLARYWAGESSGVDREEIRRRLAERPVDGALLEALDQYLARERLSLPDDIDVEAALARVQRQRARAEEEVSRGRSIFLVRPGARRWTTWRVAIPALAAAAIFAVAMYASRHSGAPAIGTTMPGARVVATGIGERDSVDLADGTRILLAPATELSIAAGYGTARRELELRGEAQFRVHHDDALPFVVRAGNLVIQDVGTVFTVLSVASDSAVVSVSEGAVRLQSAAAGTVDLHAGDVAATGPASGAVVHRGGASDLDVAWTRGKLLLRDAPLETVVWELHRWYGINLRVDDPVLQSRHYTATFDATSKPDEVLAVIRTLWGATMERQGDTVVMRRSGGS